MRSFNPMCNFGRLEKEAGVILLGTGGSIPPMSVEKMETSCVITEKKVIHPFAYRTHTHSLGEWQTCVALL
jgi:peptidylglycine monooxygenase